MPNLNQPARHDLTQMGLRVLWWLLVAASIVFAAGISGLWLNRQFPAELAAWRWGWFGAALAGLSVFGGVVLAQRGQRIGWAVAAIGASVDILVDVAFFQESHGLLMSAALGVFPMLVSFLAGIVEGRNLAADQAAVQHDQAAVVAYVHAQEAAALDHTRELEKQRLASELRQAEIKARAEARALERGVPAAVPGHGTGNAAGTVKIAPANDARMAALVAYIAEHREASWRDMAEATGVPKTTAFRLIEKAGWKRNGAGWEPVAQAAQ